MRRLILLSILVPAAIGQTTPQNFDELSAKAQQAYEANELEQAAQLYADAVKVRPEWAQGWWALGMIDYQRDHYQECRDELNRMVELDNSAPAGWALLGLCEFRTKQYDDSFQHLKRAHMMVPEGQGVGQLFDMTDYHLALLLNRQGAFELAQGMLMRVARRVHDNPEMSFASGLACLRMPIFPDEVPEKQREVVTMAGNAFWSLATLVPAESEAAFKALVSKYPKFPHVHYFYGTYLAAHHPELCAAEFLEELRITPDDVPARVELALRYILDRKLVKALQLAREAVALSPDSVGAQLALAKCLRAQGHDEQAIVPLRRARELDPVSPQISLYLASAYRNLHRIDDMRKEMAEYEQLKSSQANWP
ncbi:MAG TPA: tetratricopeptide repeat protein [Terriglobales bacterium]|nr:tetratricopeptide repeat protein [Terriglobales bacterium]